MTKAEMIRLIEALADEVKGYIDERLMELPEPKAGPQGPAGKDGAPGAQGDPGKDGAPGRDADPDLVRLLVAEVLPGMVERAQTVLADRIDARIAAIPSGKDGADGRDGADGKDGAPGRSVTVEDVLPALEAFVAKWMVEVERRADDAFRRKLAEFTQPRDGTDGLMAEDFDVEHEGDGWVVIRYGRAEVKKESRFRLPCFTDRGVYREDVSDYLRGHAVSSGGCLWISQVDNPKGRPGTPDAEGQWRLAVKAGRDGRDGKAPPAAPAAVRLR